MMKCESGEDSVLADFRAEERRLGERGEAAREEGARRLQAAGVASRASVVGSNTGPGRVVGDLEAAIRVAGNAVDQPIAVSRPTPGTALRRSARRRAACRSRRPPAASASRACRRRPERASRATGRTRTRTRRPRARCRRERARSSAARRRRTGAGTAACRYSPPSATTRSTTCSQARRAKQVAGVRLPEHGGEMPSNAICGKRVAASGGSAPRTAARRAERGGRGLPKLSSLPNIQSAPVCLKKRRAELRVVRAPELQRAKRHLRVDLARAVRRADDARLAARTRAGVARVPRRRRA